MMKRFALLGCVAAALGLGPWAARLEAQDTVMWHVRAQSWNGELTAATTNLQKLVQEAEAEVERLRRTYPED